MSKYFAPYNSDNPGGIHMRSSSKPWGAWSSEPIMVFDAEFLERPKDPCSGAGLGRFIHESWNDRKCVHVQDDIFSPGNLLDNESGGVYGPYQIPRFLWKIRKMDKNLLYDVYIESLSGDAYDHCHNKGSSLIYPC